VEGVALGRIEVSSVGLDDVELVDTLLLVVGGGVVARDVGCLAVPSGARPRHDVPPVVAVFEDPLHRHLNEIFVGLVAVIERL